MNVNDFRIYCQSKKGAFEDFPFDETTLVFKVMNKMFALVSLDKVPITANLKCDPKKSEILREEYDAIVPGYHMNKKHWNTIDLETLPTDLTYELIDHSYELVVSKLTKSDRTNLEKINL